MWATEAGVKETAGVEVQHSNLSVVWVVCLSCLIAGLVVSVIVDGSSTTTEHTERNNPARKTQPLHVTLAAAVAQFCQCLSLLTINPSQHQHLSTKHPQVGEPRAVAQIQIARDKHSPAMQLSIAGATLAGLLQSCASSPRPCVGLLFGERERHSTFCVAARHPSPPTPTRVNNTHVSLSPPLVGPPRRPCHHRRLPACAGHSR